MSATFDKTKEGRKTAWICRNCHTKFVCQKRPKDHICNPSNVRDEIDGDVDDFHEENDERRGGATGRTSNSSTSFNPSDMMNMMNAQTERMLQLQMNLQQQMRDSMLEIIQRQNDMNSESRRQDSERDSNLFKQLEAQTQKLHEVAINHQDNRKTKCPKWEAEETVDSFVERLKLWDKLEKGKGKFLELMESLQSSGRKTEKEKVELDF